MPGDGLILGTRFNWGDEFFGIEPEDRRHHVYLIGKTGTGKTTLLRNMIVQDIEAGRGVGLIDPHGDLVEEILDLIPPRRTDDVVYFNPADFGHPVAFNLLHSSGEEHWPLTASGIVSAFKNIWSEFWGPRLEYILYATVAALVSSEHTSILGIQRMLSDKQYRVWVVKQVKDPMVRAFWETEFAGYDHK